MGHRALFGCLLLASHILYSDLYRPASSSSPRRSRLHFGHCAKWRRSPERIAEVQRATRGRASGRRLSGRTLTSSVQRTGSGQTAGESERTRQRAFLNRGDQPRKDVTRGPRINVCTGLKLRSVNCCSWWRKRRRSREMQSWV